MKSSTYHHDDLRRELILAGLRIIDEEGIDRLSLRKAAAMCGVSHAAPKNHFETKEVFEEAIKKYVTEEYVNYFRQAIEQAQDSPYLIRDMGRAYVRFFTEHPQFYRLILNQQDISICLSCDHLIDSDYAPYHMFQKAASKVLRKEGVTEESLPKEIIRLWSIVNGLVGLQLMKGFHYEGDWMDMVNSIIS